MATTRKAAAKAVPAKKVVAPPRPKVEAKSTAPDVSAYRVTGRIVIDGVTLRPANPAKSREADTVELTEREAFGLSGFVELVEQEADDSPTE